MPAYPKVPLEDKLAWMRERQRQKSEEAERLLGEELMEKEPVARPVEVNGAVAAQAERLSRRKMLRVGQVADTLGVSVSTVLRWFRDRAVVVRGPRKTTMLISEQVLDEWIAEHTAQPTQRPRARR